MDARGSFLMRPALMRPGFPMFRGRGPMMMDPRVRLPPRPHPMMRGGPPAFPGRPPILPPGRPRGPVLLPHHRVPLPGSAGPLGPRGLLPPPRPMLPLPLPRPLRPDLSESLTNKMDGKDALIPVNKMSSSNGTQTMDEGKDNKNRNMRNNNVPQNQLANKNKNRKDLRDRRPVHPGPVPTQLMQNNYPTMHHPAQGPPSLSSQTHLDINPMQKQPPLMQPLGSGIQSVQSPVQSNNVRGNRNGVAQRNRGNAPVGNRGNIPMNYTPNMPNSVPNRPNSLMNGPPPGHVPHNMYGAGPPQSFSAPPAQLPLKRGGAPLPGNVPSATAMPMKRMRYDGPPPANGYPPPAYQQPPPQQSYSVPYEVPPTSQPPIQSTQDMYSNVVPPDTANMAPVQNYNNDYCDYQMNSQSNQTYGNNTYTNSYSNQSYSAPYSSNTGYDTSMDYSSSQLQNVSTVDPYQSNVDPYGYNNSTYTTVSTGYEDYPVSYVDENGYGQTAQVMDQSYNQSVNAYPSYSY